PHPAHPVLPSFPTRRSSDLNAANMIVANADGAFVHDKEFFTGAVSAVSTERHFLYWGQEYRNADPLGHMGFLNIKSQVPPSYTRDRKSTRLNSSHVKISYAV